MADYSLFKNLRKTADVDSAAEDIPADPYKGALLPGEAERTAAIEKGYKPKGQADFGRPEDWLAAMEPEGGTDKIAGAKLAPGFKPVSENKVELADGFKPVLAEGFKPVLAEGFKPVQDAGQKVPTQGKENPFPNLKGIGEETWGALKMIPDAAGFIANIPVGVTIGIRELLKHGDSDRAAELVSEYMKEALPSGYIEREEGKPMPDNRATKAVLDVIGQGVDSLAGITNQNNPTSPDFLAALGGDTSVPNDPILDPLAQEYTRQALSLGMMGGGKKGLDKAAGSIEGSFRRVPDGPLEVPGPKTRPSEVDPIAQLAEQKGVVERSQQEQLARYNNDPKTFGVDESGRINPYNPDAKSQLPPMEREIDDVPEGQGGKALEAAQNHQTPERYDFPKNDQEYIRAVFRPSAERNMANAMQTVTEFANDSFDRELAQTLLQNPIMQQVPYRLINKYGSAETANAKTIFDDASRMTVKLFPSVPPEGQAAANMGGMSPQAIIHEGVHVATYHALLVGNYITRLAQEGKKAESDTLAAQYPEAVEFSNKVRELEFQFKSALKVRLEESGLNHWKMLAHAIDESLSKKLRNPKEPFEFKRRGSTYSNMFPDEEYSWRGTKFRGNHGHEFITWGMTNPKVRTLMRQLYVSPDPKVTNLPYSVWDASSYQSMASKKAALAKKMAAPKSMWDTFVDHVAKFVGMDDATQHAKLAGRMSDALSFMEDSQSLYQQIEQIVMPFLEGRGVEYDPTVVYSAWEKFGELNNEIEKNIASGRTVYQVVDRQTGEVMGTYLNKKRAQTEMDKRDNEYGAYRYKVVPKEESIQKTPSVEMASFSKMPPKARKIASRLVSPWDNYWEMYKDLGDDMYKAKDLNRVTGNVYPVPAVKNIAKIPAITFAVTKVRKITWDTHHFEKMLVDALKDWEDAPKDLRNRVVMALNQINRPEIQDLLKQARAMNPQAYGSDMLRLLDSELTHYGAHQSDIPVYRKTLEPAFKAMLKLDEWSMFHGFHRKMTSDVVGYFPRSFGYGKFSVKGFNAQGAMEYFRRVPTWLEARKIEEALRSQGMTTERHMNKDFADFKEHIMAIQEIDPNSVISKIGEKTLEAAEEHRRTQEFERSSRGVAGYIGQVTNNPKEIELLNQLVYHRIQQTTESYRAARLLTEVLRPVQQDIKLAHWQPNTVKWITDVVRRELGAEMSKISWFDNSIQNTLDFAHIQWLKRTEKILMADRKPGESTINPITHKEMSRYMSASASAYILAGNVPNLITNLFSIPLVSLLGGVPDAMMLGKNPVSAVWRAFRAHEQSLADWTALKTGFADPDVRKFMTIALERGLTIANAFNDIPQMKADIEKTEARKAMDAALNLPRQMFNDPVEVATNVAALLYYRRLLKGMYPKLGFNENFDLAADLAKRYTGDYAKYSKALIFDKMGDPGQMGSNFNIWMGTRVGQIHELTKNVITEKQFMPLAALMLASITVAGIQGMPFVPDYENIRQFVNNHTKETHMKPVDQFLKEMDIPEWVRNGVIMNYYGLDLSTRGKWAGFTDYGGVTYTMPFKMYDIAEYTYRVMDQAFPSEEKSIIGNRYKATGPSIENDDAFVKSLPAAAQGYARQKLMGRKLREDRTTILTSHGSAGYIQKDGDYWWNILNFKTKEQAEEQRNFYNELYEKSKRDETVRSLKQHAIQQLMKYISANREGNAERAESMINAARSNLIKFQKASPKGFSTFTKDLMDEFEKETETNEEKMIKEALHSKDGLEIRRLFNQIEISKR